MVQVLQDKALSQEEGVEGWAVLLPVVPEELADARNAVMSRDMQGAHHATQSNAPNAEP
jgi:hypothetical protein